MTATTAATAAVSQELSPFGLALGVSRAGTKYPVRGIPHFDKHAVFPVEVVVIAAAPRHPTGGIIFQSFGTNIQTAQYNLPLD